MTEKQKIEFVTVEIEHYFDLKRKEQEYERLKRDYFKQNEWLQERAKECEEYKKEINRLNKVGYCYAYEKDCYKICKQQNCIIKNGYRYKQAIDEAEKVLNRLKSRTPLFEMEEIANDIINILCIIDKAKEQ